MPDPCDAWDDFTDEYAALGKRIAKLTAQRDDLLAALEAVEWMKMEGIGHLCPWCERDDFDGHTSDCQRQVAIAKAKASE